MVNRLLTSLLLVLGACTTRTTTSPVLTKADEVDCIRVYQHILSLKADEIDPDNSLNTTGRDFVIQNLDDMWSKTGTKETFTNVCHHFSKKQVDCAIEVGAITDINNCIRFLP